MAKRGRRGTGKALVSKAKLFRIEGMEETIDEIVRTMNRVTAIRLKHVFAEAAKPIWSQAKTNIAALPVTKHLSPELKEMLGAMMMINKGKPNDPKVLSGMSQDYGRKSRPDLFAKTKGRGKWKIANPYWWEFGTRSRSGPRGSITPSPFFRTAVSAKRGEVKNVLVRELKKVVEDIGG